MNKRRWYFLFFYRSYSIAHTTFVEYLSVTSNDGLLIAMADNVFAKFEAEGITTDIVQMSRRFPDLFRFQCSSFAKFSEALSCFRDFVQVEIVFKWNWNDFNINKKARIDIKVCYLLSNMVSKVPLWKCLYFYSGFCWPQELWRWISFLQA